MDNIWHFLSGLLVLIVVYYGLDYLFDILQPIRCQYRWLCGQSGEHIFLGLFVVISLGLGIYRGQQK